MTNAPEQKHRILRKFLPRSMQPLARGIRKRFFDSRRPNDEPFHTVFPYTQVNRKRQENLLRLARNVEANKIPGAIVECGVLDGGTAAIMAFATAGSAREVHLFDSWQGLPKTTEKDGVEAKVWEGECVGSQTRVRSVMNLLKIPGERLHFHQGWFQDTFPVTSIERIALLHIDADFYDSVRLSLETWFPKISPGGYVQFDDYEAFIGCTRAVDEFLSDRPGLKLSNEGMGYYIEKR